jgi:transcriptional regulator with XRE-family HTH domain
VYVQDSARVRERVQVSFGSRVRQLRLAAELTQEDLAHRCGLFRTYMSRIETGNANPTLTMIHALAASLHVPVTALFEKDEATKAEIQRASRTKK